MDKKYYSQHEEEKYILNYFDSIKLEKGNLLDIGAYNAEVFSNSRALIKKGWSGTLVEPSSSCYKSIIDFYSKEENISTVTIMNCAIGNINGSLDFYDSAGACATGDINHYNKWKEYTKDYNLIKVPCMTFESFHKKFPNTYDFITIDAEGMDWDILKQINLEELKVKCLCIEYTYNLDKIFNYITSYNFWLLHQNGENLIMVKKD